MPDKDLDRMRHEYDRRAIDDHFEELYSYDNPSYLFMLNQRKLALESLLDSIGFAGLNTKRILEVGCGSGGVLLEFSNYGAREDNLTGIDILCDRLSVAKSRIPLSKFFCADGQNLPFLDGYFDIGLQYTAFSSILDRNVKQRMAAEMQRVIKNNGLIIWYDFWLNPLNTQTEGITPKEIRKLFFRSEIHFKKITLAPPIARRIVPISRNLAVFFESLRIFNSHYLVIIRNQAK